MKLRIEYNNPTHRFISKMKVTVTADTIPLTQLSGSKPGALLFDVPDVANNASINATIPHPAGGPLSILDTAQNFQMSTAGGPAILVPQNPINQRFTVVGFQGASKTSTGILVLKLDLTFLDLTTYAANLPAPNKFTFTAQHGAAFAVLECTDDYFGRRGDEAITWAVLIPPAITAATSPVAANALLFLRPNNRDPYINTDDVANVAARLTRYTDDPDPANPFFVDGSTFSEFPNCGWERQLVEAGKPVILFWPLPHGINHGSAVSSRMPSLISSALLTLFVNGRLGTASPTTARKLALSGFSAGGAQALKTLQLLPRKGAQVDELYLFEPASFGGFVRTITEWFKLGNKKLRMLAGGYQQQLMITLANDLADPINATCKPDDLNYWYNDSLYKAGVSKKGRTEHFDLVGTAITPDFATDKSGIFFKTYDIPTKRFTLSWTQPTPLKTFEKSFVNRNDTPLPSHEEAASLVRWLLLARYLSGAAVSSPAGFNTIFTRINLNEDSGEPDRLRSIRHEWTVAGGEGSNDRQAGFKGFLQICLEKSSF